MLLALWKLKKSSKMDLPRWKLQIYTSTSCISFLLHLFHLEGFIFLFERFGQTLEMKKNTGVRKQ